MLSIMGLYEYDNNIFQGLQVPEGINRETVINEILLQCAELEIMYPNIDIMKLAITTWSIANQYTWQKLYDTMVVEYNPIWNVDANISETRAGSDNRGITRTGSGSDNRTINTQDAETVNLQDNRTINTLDARTIDTEDDRTINTADQEIVNLTDTESVKGFNSNTWAESKKLDKTGTDNITHTGTDNVAHTGTDDIAHTGTDNVTHTGTDNVAHTGTDNVAHTSSESISDQGTTTETFTQRRTGNIGVTTTQQMLEQEREIAEFNMINYIAQSFKQRFCLLIY